MSGSRTSRSSISAAGAGDCKNETSGPVIGIDLGTTFACVGIYRNGKVEIIPNENGNRITPSCVAFVGNERLVGEDAKYQNDVVFEVKRLMGREFHEDDVQSDIKGWPFRVVDGHSMPLIEVDVSGEAKTFTAEEISGLILSKMRQIAETYLKHSVTKAVITVPAYFTDKQKEATVTAGRLAGLHVLKIVNEPTAAAIAYAMDYAEDRKKRNLLVYDLGGGTFDVTILQIEDKEFHVQAYNGDNHLGGADFDVRIMDFFQQEIADRFDTFIDDDRRALRRLRAACEKAKIKLSAADTAFIDLQNLFNGEDFSSNISREKFEEICDDLFERTMEPLKQVLRDANMKCEDIDDLVLVGGSTRIPKIQQMVRDLFHGKQINKDINVDEAVAYGAVVSAAMQSPGTELAHFHVNDICPLSLGIVTAGRVVCNLIPRNTPIPHETFKIFTTNEDNQTAVRVQVCQGERVIADQKGIIGDILLEEIPKKPKGKPQIKVTFSINADAILTVFSRDLETNRTEILEIQNACNLSEQSIIDMIQQAEEFRDRDLEIMKRIEKRNELHSLCKTNGRIANLKVQMEKMLSWWTRHPDAQLEDLEIRIDVVNKLLNLDAAACRNLHDCGHLCCSVAGEAECMPCLHCDPNVIQNARDKCVCGGEMSSAPVIMLTCGHVLHADCWRNQLMTRYPGPRITFAFTLCSFCRGADIDHPSLQDILQPIRALKEEVQRKALHRLRYEKLEKSPEIIAPNGRFYKNPTGFAVEKYAYYECSKCQTAYYGGEGRCEAGAAAGAADANIALKPSDLVCGSCSKPEGGSACEDDQHSDYWGYKCRFCCSMAVFYCFGDTHFCATCHDHHSRLRAAAAASLPKCPVGPGAIQLAGECPLRIHPQKHPATGTEYWFGCSVCNEANSF